MNLFEINFSSEVLGRKCQLNVLLPNPTDISGRVEETKTLLLLHGYSDDHTAWLRKSNIEVYAREYNLAVVMPNGENSFYANMTHGPRFLEHIAVEVPSFVQSVFGLSASRENNYVAGLSMGGYGAFKIGLVYPEKFAAAASLSGVVDIQYAIDENRHQTESRFYSPLTLAFGSNGDVKNTENDIPGLLREVSTSKAKPRLFQCCGTEDELYENNLRIRDIAKSLDLDFTYEEGPGAHTWPYWDTNIKRVLEWLELKKNND